MGIKLPPRSYQKRCSKQKQEEMGDVVALESCLLPRAGYISSLRASSHDLFRGGPSHRSTRMIC